MTGRIRRRAAAVAAVFFAAVLLLMAEKQPVIAAETVMMNWYDGGKETTVSVEAGSKFYIGDFINIYSGTTAATATLVNASYQTNNRRVATVNGKGYLNARKAGTADITVTYQGKVFLCHLTVEKKGTFEKSEAVSELKAAAKKLAKGMPKSLNAAKGFTLKKKRDEYLASYGTNSASKLAYDGFLYEQERPAPDLPDYGRSEKLAVPEAGRYLTAEALLRQFRITNNPTSVTSKKTMKIASVAAGGKSGKIRIKLAGRVSAEQVLAAQLAFPYENESDIGKTKANVILSVYDQTEGKYYKAQITLKKGAGQLDATLVTSGYGGYQKAELVKGHVYLLGSKENWGNATKVTAN